VAELQDYLNEIEANDRELICVSAAGMIPAQSHVGCRWLIIYRGRKL